MRIIGAYLVAVTAIAAWMFVGASTPTAKEPTKEPTMPIQWSVVHPAGKVSAAPPGVWSLAVEYVKGPALIKIEASGTWTYSPGKSCGPDGDRNALLSAAQMIVPAAPVGALVAKIGGSTAVTADGTVYVVGSQAYIRLADDQGGPLFLTINDDLPGFTGNDGELSVVISVQQQTPPTAPAARKAPAPKKKKVDDEDEEEEEK